MSKIRRAGPGRLLATVLCVAGCSPQSAKQPPPEAPRFEGIQLRLAVVDDPGLAQAIGRLQGEWKAQTGSTLEVRELTPAALTAGKPIDGDALIYPSAGLGTLVERGLITPIPQAVLQSEDLAWNDIFEALQTGETVWGDVAYAIPFGSPVLTCWYRADLLKQLERQPPKSWEEYQELARFLSDRANLGPQAPAADSPWSGALEPLAAGWRGRVLLARAAAYAKHRESYSTLFHIDTMEPLIASPPFVRALEELAAAAKTGPHDRLALDPAGVRREVLAGRAALALTWPSAAGARRKTPGGSKIAVGFSEAPGSREVFHLASAKWEKRSADEDPAVTVLSVAGRLGSVSEQSENPVPAAALLAWLASPKWSVRTATASPATTLYRTSHVASPQAWTDPEVDAAAAKTYARSVQRALNRTAHFSALRIPGEAEYAAALDEAVKQAVSGAQPAADALADAAAKWRAITKRLGVDKQHKAYRRSLRLEP